MGGKGVGGEEEEKNLGKKSKKDPYPIIKE